VEAAGRRLHRRKRRALDAAFPAIPWASARGIVIYAGRVSESDEATVRPVDRYVFASFGAVFFGYIVAWLFAVQANQLIGIDDRFQQALMDFGDFFAIVAPALWFFTVLTQIRTTRWRVVALVVGLGVLFPFPLFFGVSPV
jgi:hypothetical protein